MVENINNLPNAKYKEVPNDVEKTPRDLMHLEKDLKFVRLEKVNREKNRLERFDKKNYQRKKNQVKTSASSRRSAPAWLYVLATLFDF